MAPAYEKFGGPWYDYEGSYWKKLVADPKGIDAALISRAAACTPFTFCSAITVPFR